MVVADAADAGAEASARPAGGPTTVAATGTVPRISAPSDAIAPTAMVRAVRRTFMPPPDGEPPASDAGPNPTGLARLSAGWRTRWTSPSSGGLLPLDRTSGCPA